MAFKLDDLLSKKKEPNQILDLSKVKIRSKEEFEKQFDKIPEYKIRPEKLREEDIRIREGEYSFHRLKKECKKREFKYEDPVPVSMRSVRLDDLAEVEINWRMLTVARPDSRLDEEYFNRLVELGKLRLSSLTTSRPDEDAVRMRGPRGASEKRLRSCKECGEELCPGILCKLFPYDSYTRLHIEKEEDKKKKKKILTGNKNGKKLKIKRKKKRKKKVKEKAKKPETSKSSDTD